MGRRNRRSRRRGRIELSKKNKLQDFETKKSIHFTTTREAHAEVRIACFKNKLTMQEVFEELSQQIAAGSPEMVRFMEKLSEDKRIRKIKKLSKIDADSIFSVIEEESPLK